MSVSFQVGTEPARHFHLWVPNGAGVANPSHHRRRGGGGVRGAGVLGGDRHGSTTSSLAPKKVSKQSGGAEKGGGGSSVFFQKPRPATDPRTSSNGVGEAATAFSIAPCVRAMPAR